MGKLIDLTGQRFGKLTVLRKGISVRHPSGGISATWICRCECGKELSIISRSLLTGRSTSCGCIRSEIFTQKHINRIHGESHHGETHKATRLYRVWVGMRERCNNPNHNRWQHYGGRGIRVCEEWNDYENFKRWAMRNGYDPEAPRGKCTIDRINVNGDYEPENCRWVDMKTQYKNTRRSVH